MGHLRGHGLLLTEFADSAQQTPGHVVGTAQIGSLVGQVVHPPLGPDVIRVRCDSRRNFEASVVSQGEFAPDATFDQKATVALLEDLARAAGCAQ